MAGELVLIGIGPGRIDGWTVEARREAAACDHRFLEGYTARLPEATRVALEQAVGAIESVMRPAVEQPDRLLGLARHARVGLLVVGDPLQATTHVDLELRAAADGIPVRVVHGVSITTIATGAIGLSNYRFGRSTTLTYPYGDWLPTSPLEVIEGNLRAGLHTLVLLDLDPTGAGTGEQSPMQPDVASSVLRRCMERLGRPVLEGRDLVLCTDMGTEDQVILTTDLEGLAFAKPGGMHCLVIPADPTGLEADTLARWR